VVEVSKKPSSYRRIEHHQQKIAKDADVTIDMPLATLGLQRPHCPG